MIRRAFGFPSGRFPASLAPVKRACWHHLFPALAALAALGVGGSLGGAETDARPRAARPADELFWVPTLDQAVAMATANQVPVFVMGYSLVGDRSTYTKLDEDCASAVF